MRPSLLAGQTTCIASIGLDNVTDVNYTTLVSVSATAVISVWYGTSPFDTADYSKLFSARATSLSTTVNQSTYPSALPTAWQPGVQDTSFLWRLPL